MNPDRYLLDTSALLTLIEDEAGADRVEQLLTQAEVWLPWLALLEATYITRQERGESEAERRYALIKQLPATLLWEIDEPILLTAARLKADHHLSLPMRSLRPTRCNARLPFSTKTRSSRRLPARYRWKLCPTKPDQLAQLPLMVLPINFAWLLANRNIPPPKQASAE